MMRLPCRLWLPTDANLELRASIIAWTEHNGCDNVHAPLELDVREPVWALEKGAVAQWLNTKPIVAIVNINMIHIYPPGATRFCEVGQTKVRSLIILFSTKYICYLRLCINT